MEKAPGTQIQRVFQLGLNARMSEWNRMISIVSREQSLLQSPENIRDHSRDETSIEVKRIPTPIRVEIDSKRFKRICRRPILRSRVITDYSGHEIFGT
jgi:hypothetical protein